MWALHQLSRGSAGSRTLSLLMRRNSYDIGRWLARKLMQECGLLSRQPGRHRYRGAREEALASPNKPAEKAIYADLTEPDMVWIHQLYPPPWRLVLPCVGHRSLFTPRGGLGTLIIPSLRGIS